MLYRLDLDQSKSKNYQEKNLYMPIGVPKVPFRCRLTGQLCLPYAKDS